MVNPQLHDFYDNWLRKADSYQQENLSNHFDKFTSLYVLFNSLYMQVMTELVANGHHLPREFKDKIAATDYVTQYLGGAYYIDTLLDQREYQSALESICNIIDQEQFHIILHWGVQQRAKDLDLLALLRSNNKQNKSKAILSLFYHIRCNMLHGHKNYVDGQMHLLAPTNKLLRRTVEITFNRLNI
jgi:hypothetical protein